MDQTALSFRLGCTLSALEDALSAHFVKDRRRLGGGELIPLSWAAQNSLGCRLAYHSALFESKQPTLPKFALDSNRDSNSHDSSGFPQEIIRIKS